MYRLIASVNGEAAVIYFNEGLKTEGLYLDEGGTIDADWKGKTAGFIGIHGEKVDKETFLKLVNKQHPKKDEKLCVRQVDNARAGYDHTFSAPKSASIVHAFTKDPVIHRAHIKAYTAAIEYIEKHVQVQANTEYGRFYETTGNMIYAAFDHYLSRPVEVKHRGKTVYASDCQVHSHLYMPSVTFHEESGEWRAVEVFNLFQRAVYTEAIYHAHFSKALSEVGYSIVRTPDRWEIAGVSRDVIERYSNRTRQIEEIIKEENITDPKQKNEVGPRSRKSKQDLTVSKEKLFEVWKDRLTPAEFKALLELKDKHFDMEKPLTAKEAIDRSLAHHLERNSTAQEPKVLATALNYGYGHLLPEDVEKELNSRGDIFKTEIDTVPVITTRQMLKAEDKMLELAVEGKGQYSPINTNYEIKADFFNQQQKNAVHTTLQSRDFASILRGKSGVGKTTILKEIRKAHLEINRPIFATAPSAKAAREVLRSEGFEADTIASLLSNPELAKKIKGGTLLVDEAGQVGVQDMSDIFTLARSNQARIVLSGDTAQHGPVQAGSALHILQQKGELTTATVTKNVRQRHNEDYRKAVEAIGNGRVLEGYQILDKKMEAVVEEPDLVKRLDATAQSYVDTVKKGRTALIISPTHFEADILNHSVRAKLRANGKISGPDRSFDTLKSLSLTDAQKQDAVNYQDNNRVLRFTKNSPGGFKAGSHHEIIPDPQNKNIQIKNLKTGEIKPLPRDLSERYEVFERTKIKLAQGDLIRMSVNSQSMEGSKLNNGNTYSIRDFDKEGNMILSNGRTLSKDVKHIRPGYVDTSFSAQGKSTEVCLVSMSEMSYSATNQEAFYVAVSRGSKSLQVLTDDKKELQKHIARSSIQLTARDVAEDHQRNLLQQRQRAHHRSLNEKIKNYAKTKQPAIAPQRDIRDGKQPGIEK